LPKLAAELHESEKSRVQVEHFSKRFPEMTVEDGYAISREWVKHKIAEGRTVKGHKIGLTSRAMQQSSQIDEPDYGTLLDDMFFEQGGDIPFARFIAPRIEVELAFILGRKLRARRDALRRARRHRLRGARHRDHRCAHRAVRPPHQGAAQGVRHHLRQRGQRRHRDGRPAGEARCGRPALGERASSTRTA
jgi:hypothetical protein